MHNIITYCFTLKFLDVFHIYSWVILIWIFMTVLPLCSLVSITLFIISPTFDEPSFTTILSFFSFDYPSGLTLTAAVAGPLGLFANISDMSILCSSLITWYLSTASLVWPVASFTNLRSTPAMNNLVPPVLRAEWFVKYPAMHILHEGVNCFTKSILPHNLTAVPLLWFRCLEWLQVKIIFLVVLGAQWQIFGDKADRASINIFVGKHPHLLPFSMHII